MPASPRSLVLALTLGLGALGAGCGGPPRTQAARERWQAEEAALAAARPDDAADVDGAADVAAPLGAALAADVASPEALVRACYDVISGPAGPRDWARFRSLFHPELGRLVPLATRADGSQLVGQLRPDDYAERAAATFAAQDFYERELSLEVRRFGGVAQVFSAYAITHSAAPDAPVVDRGVNCFQLCSDGTRWYVLSISWDAERPGLDLQPLLDAAAR